MKRTIGKMVYVLREEKGISQKNLADGLLSIAELSRIESGNRDEDSFVLAEDYRIYEKVNLYKNCYYQKKRERAYALLHELEQELDLTNPINWQFIVSFS